VKKVVTNSSERTPGVSKSSRGASPYQGSPATLPDLPYGIVAKVACKCSPEDDADFLIKTDRIVCGACGKEILCAPPLLGVFKATCACCCTHSIKTTFILDSTGAYVCTWCGARR
jgi:hypothetical protein